MDAVRRAVRCALVVIGVAVTALAGPGNTSLAAVAPTNPDYAVAKVQPTPGRTVGVAHPVVVTLTKPIADRAAFERTFRVLSPEDATGRFDWIKDDTVQWIPDRFWPAHSQVTMLVAGAPLTFETGSAVVGVADISAHTFTVSIDGQVARVMPASMGKPSRPTPVGSYSVLEKDRSVEMDSRTIGIPLSSPEGYDIIAQYAERITSSGVYVHSAPWSLDSQGNANVSHGCINLSPDNAAWYYDVVHVGDPVIVQP